VPDFEGRKAPVNESECDAFPFCVPYRSSHVDHLSFPELIPSTYIYVRNRQGEQKMQTAHAGENSHRIFRWLLKGEVRRIAGLRHRLTGKVYDDVAMHLPPTFYRAALVGPQPAEAIAMATDKIEGGGDVIFLEGVEGMKFSL
jgi:hypothetical protein